MSQLLVTARALVTPRRHGGVEVHRDVGLWIEDGVIRALDRAPRLVRQFPDCPRAGGDDALLIPGLVNAHSHGMGVSNAELGTPDLPLELWVAMHLGRPKPPRAAEACLSAVRQLRGGITTTVHSQSGGGFDDARQILDGYRRSGIRAMVAVHARNQNRIAYERDELFLARLPRKVAAALRRVFPPVEEHYVSRYVERLDDLEATGASELLTIAYGPAGVQWADAELWRAVTKGARRTGRPVHTHLLESPYEKIYGPKVLGMETVAWLRAEGHLSRRFTGAHGVWLDPPDIATLAARRALLVHCPSSNMRLSSGRMPLLALRAAGVDVALGMDSAGLDDDDDLFTEMRLALWLHNEPAIDGRRLTSAEVLEMATLQGARSMGRDDEIGCIEPGMLGDLVLLDARTIDPRLALEGPALLDALVARGSRAAVRTVVVGGKVVVERGRHVRLSERALERAARQMAPEDAELAALRRPLCAALEGFYRTWRLPERRHRPDATFAAGSPSRRPRSDVSTKASTRAARSAARGTGSRPSSP